MNKKIKRSIVILSIIFVTICPTFAKKTNATRTVIDHDGENVKIPNTVNRVAIVSIWPLPSVMTVFLGSADKLVGIPPASLSAARTGLLGEIFPNILTKPTSFTTGEDVNIEELLKLNPDVVFCSASEQKTKEAIKNAGIPCVAFSVNKWNYNILETYDGWIDLLGQVFPENTKKNKVKNYSQQVFNEIQNKVKDIPSEKQKKVLFLFQYNDKTIITSGKKFFGQFWCDAVGAKNVAESVGAENANAKIDMEQIYAWNPDVILITNFTPALPEDLYNNKVGGYDWSSVKAVREHKVYKMPLGTYRSYTPSADTPVTLTWIAQKVYPELFADIDLTKQVKDYFKEMYGISLTNKQIDLMYNQTAESAKNIKL